MANVVTSSMVLYFLCLFTSTRVYDAIQNSFLASSFKTLLKSDIRFIAYMLGAGQVLYNKSFYCKTYPILFFSRCVAINVNTLKGEKSPYDLLKFLTRYVEKS